MKALPGFTDAQVSGRLNGMPHADLGTILGPDTSGGYYMILAVTDDGVCLVGRASMPEVMALAFQESPRSVTESQMINGLRQ